jgi:phosphoribosylamine--glycine ligase
VVVEEFLSGIELSVFVLTDGKHYRILPAAKDYKRIGEGDTGPNTGGMGAVSPVPFADPEFMERVEARVVRPTVAGLQQEGIDYRGFLFIGLMNVDGHPYVIEYNVRLGDPETEVVVPRIENDLVDLLVATANQTLDQADLQISEHAAATVVMVAQGYPGTYPKGAVIHGLPDDEDALVFHAGTRQEAGNVLTNGGRVLAVTAQGRDIAEALRRSYDTVHKIRWEGQTYRTDIGQDLLKYQ